MPKMLKCRFEVEGFGETMTGLVLVLVEEYNRCDASGEPECTLDGFVLQTNAHEMTGAGLPKPREASVFLFGELEPLEEVYIPDGSMPELLPPKQGVARRLRVLSTGRPDGQQVIWCGTDLDEARSLALLEARAIPSHPVYIVDARTGRRLRLFQGGKLQIAGKSVAVEFPLEG